MISDTAQVNTFVQGMDLDTDINMIPESRYRFGQDVRVVTNDGGTTGVLQSIENPRKYGTELPLNEVIIGATTVEDIAVVITRLENGNNKIYRIRDFDTRIPQVKVVCKGKLGLCQDLSKTPRISLVANYESDTNIKIYFTDGNDPVKTLNIMSDAYVINSELIDENGDILNPGALDLTPDATLPPLKFMTTGIGNLKVGMVTYCYQLFNLHGTETVTSPLSELIHLTPSTTNQGSASYKGEGIGKSANKSVILKTDLSMHDFSKMRIIRIFYEQNNSTPTIDIVDEFDISNVRTTINYTDYGATLSTLSVEEFNAMTGYQFIAQTLAKGQNRLFAANITDNTWVPKNEDGTPYDARAYRASKAGIVQLLSSSDNQKLLVYITDDNQLKRIPLNHDCINPSNTQQFTGDGTNYSLAYVHGKDGKLGGYGINIEYSFVTTDIKLSKQQSTWRLNQDCSMNVEAVRGTSRYIYDSTDSIIDTIEPTIDQASSVSIPNYADPYVAANYTGYQRDEIYRFGIVFYNKKFIASPVLWIGDIRMPHASQMPPFVYYDRTLIGKALGVNFKVKKMPVGAVAYEIVRCDRTEADRTVMMQTVGSYTYEYRIQEQDKYMGQGPTLANSLELRPLPFFCSLAKHYLYTNYANTKVSSLNMTQYRDKQYIRLVSPEICIQGENIERIFDGSCYLENVGTYYSPFVGGTVKYSKGFHANSFDDAYIDGNTIVDGSIIHNTIFANANIVMQLDGTLAAIDTIPFVGCHEAADSVGMCFNSQPISGNTVYHNAYIAKYFVPDFTMPHDSTHVIVEDAKYPPLIAYNQYNASDIVANRINIGERTYTNYSVTEFEQTDNETIVGPAGPCIIAYVPKLDVIFNGYGKPTDRYSQMHVFDAVNAVPVFNVKRNGVSPYGGDIYSVRQNSVYISTGGFNGKYVFGGDTYLSLLDYPNTMSYQLADAKEWDDMKCFIGAYIPFESTINMNLMHGDQIHRTVTASDFADSWLQLDPTQMQQVHTQDLPYFLYNAVYSASNTGKFYVPNSIYAEENQQYSNRILSSQAKTANEVIDQWSKFKPADYLDVDNRFGAITNLRVFKDRLFYFQNSGVGIAAVNERALITDDNVNQITLGTGGILSRYDYIADTNGDSNFNDKSIINSDNVLYWYDPDKNELCSYTGQVSQISKEKQVQTHFNEHYMDDRTNPMSLFDKKYNEVWFNIFNQPIVFNEQLGRFTSFYTFNPKWSLPLSDRLATITKDNKLYTIHDTGVKALTPVERDSQLQIVINKDDAYTKVFDNVRFQGSFKDTEGNELREDLIDYMKFSTKHQEAKKEHTKPTEDNPVEEHIITDYREDTFRFPVPRADVNEDELSLPARLRGKYMVCDYHLDSDTEHSFEIPQITTTYRRSRI